MSGRETVIKAVEYLNWYFTQDDGTADKNAVKAWEVLRQEQEPVPPDTAGAPWWRCGGCGGDIVTEQFKFCPWCGRAVKWEVTGE